jgi:hypothetical protein
MDIKKSGQLVNLEDIAQGSSLAVTQLHPEHLHVGTVLVFSVANRAVRFKVAQVEHHFGMKEDHRVIWGYVLRDPPWGKKERTDG